MKTYRHPLPAALLLCLFLSACTTFYTGVVTLTKTVESAARDYAVLFNDGLVPPELHVKVSNAHLAYRKAAGVAAAAIEAGGQNGQAALEAARAAAFHFVDLLVGLLDKQRIATLRTQVKEASVI